MSSASLWVVRVRCDPPAAAAVEFLFESAGAPCAAWQCDAGGDTALSVYAETRRDADALAERLATARESWPDGVRCEAEVVRLAREDWAETWKRFFHTERVSRRIVVRPSWEEWDARPDDCVVSVDPGMSFGTGLHFTTRSCLGFLDQLTTQTSAPAFCDLGCGSGILSIAAALLGVTQVMAVDSDPEAIRATRENADRNGVGDCLAFTHAGLADFRPVRCYPLVAANILGHVLREQVNAVVGTVAPGGRLILAGMTVDDAAPTLAVYAARGLEVAETAHDPEWVTALLVRG